MTGDTGDIIDDTSRKIKRTIEKCNVCDYPYGVSIRSRVACKHCGYTSCKSCYKQYFLSKANPQCMNCNTIWTQDVLESCFPRTWCNSEYRKHMQNVMFQQELSLMPLATRELDKRKLQQQRERMTEDLNDLESHIDSLRQTIVRYNRRAASGTHWAISERDSTVPSLEKQIRQEEEKYNKMVADIISFNEQHDFDNTNIVSSRPCFTPECRGYLNFRYECVVCNTSWCKDCHERLQQGHICDQNLVKTYKMLEKDTKNCPSCKTLIFKISGCDQMYCINCNTAFSWETGQVEKGRIHNPHYFEYVQRREQQQTAQVNTECVDINLSMIMKTNDTKGSRYNKTLTDFIIEVERFITHVDETILDTYTRTIRENPINRNLDIRIDYLLKEIDEKTFKSHITTRDTRYKLHTHYYNLIYSLSMVCRDILVRYIQDANYSGSDLRNELIEYGKYFNLEMEKVAVWFEQTHKMYLQINETNVHIENVKRVKNEMHISEEEANNLSSKTEWLDSDEKRYMEHYEWLFDHALKFCDVLNKKHIQDRNYQEAAEIYLTIFDKNTDLCEALWDYETLVSERNKRRIRTNVLNIIMNKMSRTFRMISNAITGVYRYLYYNTTVENYEIVTLQGYRMLLFFLPFYTVYMPNQVISMNVVHTVVCYLSMFSVRYCKSGRQRMQLGLCNLVGTICERFLQHEHIGCTNLTRSEQLWNSFYERVYSLKPDGPGARYVLTQQYKDNLRNTLTNMYNKISGQTGYTRKQILRKQHSRLVEILGLAT
jgi:hypothetical protein